MNNTQKIIMIIIALVGTILIGIGVFSIISNFNKRKSLMKVSAEIIDISSSRSVVGIEHGTPGETKYQYRHSVNIKYEINNITYNKTLPNSFYNINMRKGKIIEIYCNPEYPEIVVNINHPMGTLFSLSIGGILLCFSMSLIILVINGNKMRYEIDIQELFALLLMGLFLFAGCYSLYNTFYDFSKGWNSITHFGNMLYLVFGIVFVVISMGVTIHLIVFKTEFKRKIKATLFMIEDIKNTENEKLICFLDEKKVMYRYVTTNMKELEQDKEYNLLVRGKEVIKVEE